MKRKLVIIGASGHGKVVANVAQEMNVFKSICFLDDDKTLSECSDFPVVGRSWEAEGYIGKSDIFVAVSSPET